MNSGVSMSTMKKAKPVKRIASKEEKIRAVSLLYNRLNRGFALYLWKTRVHPMLAEHPGFSDEKFAIVTVKNACVESVLLSVRDIDDFFRPRASNTRDSDVRAEDFFGYRSPGPFLSEEERGSINQWIAHLTYEPVWSRNSGVAPEPTRNWDSSQLLGKAARSVFDFLEHIERELLKDDVAVSEDIRRVRSALTVALKNMEALADFERSSFAAETRLLAEQSF